MACSSSQNLVTWSDFPTGLRVLLLDKDESSAAETQLKLESMDYVVSLFHNDDDALKAVSDEAENFHVALIEVTNSEGENNFKFLEMARNLPTIVISNAQCLSTMMKCIALGAVEFSQKPLSEEKLKNIWQHVVHKAFNAGERNVLLKSLKPVKETIVSMLQLQPEVAKLNVECPSKQDNVKEIGEFLEPSTPQLPLSIPTEKRRSENTKESPKSKTSSYLGTKPADNAFYNSGHTSSVKDTLLSEAREAALEEEVNSSATREGCPPPISLHNGKKAESNLEVSNIKVSYVHACSREKRKSKKQMKVDWTPDLHRKFVQAVEQLGVDQAIPSKILQLMKVDGLTRYNVASHLQKYRMHRRHSFPGQDTKRWPQNRDLLPKNCMQKPVVAVPKCQTSYGIPQTPMNYSLWNHRYYHHSAGHMWSNTAAYAAWQQSLPPNWPWKNYPGVQADAWGCPVMPFSGQYPASTQALSMNNAINTKADSKELLLLLHDNSFDQLAEEVIDKAVKEATSKPWLPLPIGLKQPSTASVLSELHRQGIRRIPPLAKRSPLHGTAIVSSSIT